MAVIRPQSLIAALFACGGAVDAPSNDSGVAFDTSTTVTITQLAAGASYTCAALSSGVVKCWGRNAEGILLDGTDTDRSLPTVAQGLPADVVSVAE